MKKSLLERTFVSYTCIMYRWIDVLEHEWIGTFFSKQHTSKIRWDLCNALCLPQKDTKVNKHTIRMKQHTYLDTKMNHKKTVTC